MMVDSNTPTPSNAAALDGTSSSTPGAVPPQPAAIGGAQLMKHKARAGLVHVGAGALVVAAVAALALSLWFPGAYRELSGGLHLLLLVGVVDIVMGPVLTFVVFNPAKPRAELVRDLGIIVLLQLAALGYGVWTLAQARPTHLVFEVDLFRVITASDIEPSELARAPADLQRLPWTGPLTIGVAKPQGSKEQMESVMRSMAGQPLAAMPQYWVPFESQREQVLSKARPLSDLPLPDAAARQKLDQALAQAGLKADQARWLHLMARRAQWTVIVDSQGQPRALVALAG